MSVFSQRYLQLDFLRGFAVLGIFQINILYFGQPYELYAFPTVAGNHDWFNSIAWFISSLFIEGSMYGLFSLLFGASALLILDKITDNDCALGTVDFYYRRMMWLIVIGIVHAYILLSPMEILLAYGVLGLTLFPLRKLNAWTLLIAGVLLFLLGMFDFIIISDAEASSLPAAEEDKLSVSSLLTDIRLFRSDYAAIFYGNLELAASWQSVNFFEDHLYDAGGMMLIGMAFYKWKIITGERPWWLYLLFMLTGYSLALLLRWPEHHMLYLSDFDPEVFYAQSNGPNLLGRLFLVMGHIGFLLTLYRLAFMQWFVRLLANCGKMALSHYLLQTIFSIVLFYGFGAGYYGHFERYELMMIATAFAIVQIIISQFWMGSFQFGPAEWLWRSLAKKQLQPFIK